MKKLVRLKILIMPILVFILYILITALIFNHRLPYLFTHYAMPDVDTDGGLWYKWFLYYTQVHKLPYDVIYLNGYPYGYDISLSPISNIIYSFEVFILTIIGFSWSNLILITNISSLVTYPLAALGAYFLGNYIMKNKMIAFLVGIIFSFSFYHVFMGRGQMSINHTEFIPFYVLSLLYYIDRKNTFSLLLSTTIFSVMFMADAYYAFFSGIFSLIILLIYKEENWKTKIRSLIIYYCTLFVILIILNFNFIFSNLYLFNKAKAAATGRNSIPINELTDILYYYTPIKENMLFNFLTPLNYFIYVLPILLITIGASFMHRSRIFITFLACLCIAIVLSAFVPGFYWINLFYFKYFGMFRGVGRMILPAYLFVGILTGMSVNVFWKYLKEKKIYQVATIGCLTILSLVVGIPSDQTWFKLTDFSKLAQVYQPIKDNKNIQVVAAYPLSLNFDNTGFPQPYQLLGQIIDEKTFANGAALYNDPSISYQKTIKNIQDPKTITILANNGVDTLLIYNKLLTNASAINKQLLTDKMVTFLGRYTAGYDGGNVSANELSRDINVYHIKNVKHVGVLKQPLFFYLSSGQKINYTQISPYKFVIRGVKNNPKIIFSYPYSDKWQMYPGNVSAMDPFTLLVKEKKNSILHSRYDGYENLWQPTSQSSEYTIIFQPQLITDISNIVSSLVLYILIFILIITGLRQFKKHGN